MMADESTSPPVPADGGAVGRDLATIEQRMHTDFRGYQADTHQQGRYLELIRAREGGGSAAPAPASGRATELAQLEALMADPQSAYWKGPLAEQNQRRYLELLGGGPTLADGPRTKLADLGAVPPAFEAHGVRAMVGEEALVALKSYPEGAALARRCGKDAALDVSRANNEILTVVGTLSFDEAERLVGWFEELPGAQKAGIVEHFMDIARAKASR